MPPWLKAAIDIGHILGVVIGIGGMLYVGFVLSPAAAKLPADERAELMRNIRQRARALTYTAVGLLLITGILKWAPPNGVGWLGHGGYRTAFLHGKLVIALGIFHFAFALAREPKNDADAARRPRRARIAAIMGIAVVCLAVLHKTGL